MTRDEWRRKRIIDGLKLLAGFGLSALGIYLIVEAAKAIFQ